MTCRDAHPNHPDSRADGCASRRATQGRKRLRRPNARCAHPMELLDAPLSDGPEVSASQRTHGHGPVVAGVDRREAIVAENEHVVWRNDDGAEVQGVDPAVVDVRLGDTSSVDPKDRVLDADLVARESHDALDEHAAAAWESERDD